MHIFDYPIFANSEINDPPVCEDCRELYMDGIFCEIHHIEQFNGKNKPN